jgi:DNA-binding NarL/FixJ family response regulator
MNLLQSADEGYAWADPARPAGRRSTDGTGESRRLAISAADEIASRGGVGEGWDRAPVRVVADPARDDLQTLLYLDPRAFTRECVGRWLQGSLRGCRVCVLPDPEQIETAPTVGGEIRAVVINTGSEPMSSAWAADLVSRVKELLPGVPVAVLSDFEDRENVREAFNLGVRGYIPTTLASLVAAGALSLVCLGGTFAPATALLSEDGSRRGAVSERPIEGFTQRQAQILDCLRRGMANKLIAFELDMCESTVKVHIRNIMKKLNATNRTQVVYLTRGLFEGNRQYQGA